MILDRTNIVVPELCPIQFTEPSELTFYPDQQRYLPKVIGGTRIQIFISETWYDSTDTIWCELIDVNDNVIASVDAVKAELSAGYWYATFTFSNITDSELAYFSIKRNGIEAAYSVWYQLNPEYDSDIKRIEYNHSENDYNYIFDATNYFIDVECGFKPEDIRIEEEAEDFLEQDMVNETVYGDQYEVLPLTIGDNLGVPAWMAVKVARALKCDTVIIDGTEYKRTTGAKIEKGEMTYNGLNSYKIDLQKTNNYIQ